jgi:hypothetical protein
MGLWGQVAPTAAALAFTVPTSLTSGTGRQIAVFLAVAVAAVTTIVKLLDKPSRPYNREANTVGNEYDAWCEVRNIVTITKLSCKCSDACFFARSYNQQLSQHSLEVCMHIADIVMCILL